MLLQIEVFPPAGKAENGKASQTLFVSPSTVANRYGTKTRIDNDNDDDNDDKTDDDATIDQDDIGPETETNPNAGLVATIGRKGEMDILFGADRSISRQHAFLRFVAPRAKPKSRRTTTRGKTNNNVGDENQGCFMEPRNKNEEEACNESPYGMCLVLENKGKSGSYIASRDKSHTQRKEQNNSNDHDSDATTDDDGGSISQQQSSQRINYGTATSLTTQLGEVILSSRGSSSSQKLPTLSQAVQQHFGNDTPVRLTRVDVDESLVLKFDGTFGNGGKNSEHPSILVQFGCALLPTIKITLVPMMVVFSSGVPSAIQDSLRLCGGLSQKAGSLPCLPSSSQVQTDGTTHMVATERMAVAKQLIAWCYGIPIVSPEFLVALRRHSSPKNPFPSASDFSPNNNTDTNEFWDWKADPTLLKDYIMMSVDPSPEVEQAEGLALAAGATLERFYEPKKKPTKAKIQKYLERVRELLQEAADATTGTTPKKVVLLSSKTKSKYANNNTTNFLKELKEELSVPLVGSKILAKTITKQESVLVGLVESNATSTTSTQRAAATRGKRTQPKATIAVPDAGEAPGTPQPPESKLEKNRMPSLKREHEEVCREKAAAGAENENTGLVEKKTSPDARSSKRLKVDPQKQQQQQQQQQQQEDEKEDDFVLPVDDHHESSNRKTADFEKVDSNGWFTAAPKNDRVRLRLRQRASEAYQTKTGTALEASAATCSLTIHVTAMNDSSSNQSSNSRSRIAGAYTTIRHSKPSENLPNFKRFRKNHVPARTDQQEVVILVDATLSQQAKTSEEVSAEELELRENQRLAEALFHGEPVLGMGKKKRRVRK